MRKYQEELELYITNNELDKLIDGQDRGSINTGLEEQPETKTVIKSLHSAYEDQVIIVENVLQYKYNGTEKSKERVKWAFEANIPVYGYATYEEFLEDVQYAPITTGQYTAVDGVYVCSPDLTGFNREKTFYVTYDSTGNNEQIGNSLKAGAPDNITDWYDYSSSVKKWANVVTIDGDKQSYWVWIPRYVYMIDAEAKTAQSPKIKFVDINNNYKDFETGEIINYPDTEATFDENGNQTNYILPAAFKWDGQDIPGYWVAKYEMSEDEVTDINLVSSSNSIRINSVSGNSFSIDSYDIYLNNEFYANAQSFPFDITGLIGNTSYTVAVKAKLTDGRVTAGTSKNITTGDIMFTTKLNDITIEKIKVQGTTPASYDVYINGELDTNVTSFPYTITPLNINTKYQIKIVCKNSSGEELVEYNEIVKTLEKPLAEVTKPDLTGFVVDKTFIVTYSNISDETTEDRTVPISSILKDGYTVNSNNELTSGEVDLAKVEALSNTWYDYENKNWANIVTIDGDKEAYFVWIPRYEYKTRPSYQEVEVRFITKDQSEPTQGYKFSEAFNFGGTPIPGYWVAKYEMSE